MLMEKALSLNWTQNTVILECCETDEQRSFYIDLAIELNFSKLALMKAIVENTFATASGTETPDENAEASFAPVGDILPKEAVDTTASVETACEPFVSACEPPRQRDNMPNRIGSGYIAAIAKIPNGRWTKHIPGDPSPPSRIYALLKHLTPMAIQIQKQKPPWKPPPGILWLLKISTFLCSRVQYEIQQYGLCPMQIVA